MVKQIKFKGEGGHKSMRFNNKKKNLKNLFLLENCVIAGQIRNAFFDQKSQRHPEMFFFSFGGGSKTACFNKNLVHLFFENCVITGQY